MGKSFGKIFRESFGKSFGMSFGKSFGSHSESHINISHLTFELNESENYHSTSFEKLWVGGGGGALRF